MESVIFTHSYVYHLSLMEIDFALHKLLSELQKVEYENQYLQAIDFCTPLFECG